MRWNLLLAFLGGSTGPYGVAAQSVYGQRQRRD